VKPNSILSWQVNYQPGTLSAKGFDGAGQIIAETKIETTGQTSLLQLVPDRRSISADGEDVVVYSVSGLDAQGRFVTLANNKINFSIEGSGAIIGVGNGDPACHEPDKIAPGAAWSRSLFNGMAQVIVQSTLDAGEIKLTASAEGLQPAAITVQTQQCSARPAVP
jgi:beta-galactosidase